VKVVIKGIEDNLFRSDINPHLVNRCLFAMGRSIMDTEVYPFELFSRREVIKGTYINYLRGISTPLGIELINKLEENF
jgi:hypothetical protein